MDRVGMRARAGSLLVVGLLVTSACGGSGQTHHLDVIPKQGPAQAAEPDGVKVVIEPFEDRRAEKNRVGMRTHLWGGVTHFNVTGEKPGEVYAQALAERLRAKGWRERSWDVRVAPAGSAPSADILISGQILDLTANAKSRVFSTALTSSSKVMITARNNSDRSATTRTVDDAETKTVFWFDEEDVQDLLRETIKDSIDRYVEDTTVIQRAVRPTR